MAGVGASGSSNNNGQSNPANDVPSCGHTSSARGHTRRRNPCRGEHEAQVQRAPQMGWRIVAAQDTGQRLKSGVQRRQQIGQRPLIDKAGCDGRVDQPAGGGRGGVP